MADGNVLRSQAPKPSGDDADKGDEKAAKGPEREYRIPLWMIFPRSYTCASLLTATYRVEFEVNIVISFTDSLQVTQNFPLRLYRSPDRGADPGHAGP